MSTPSGGRRHADLNAVRAAARTAAVNTPPTNPRPAPTPPRTTRRDGPPPSAALARAPFVVMFVASVICMVIRFVPEVAFAPEVFDIVFSQLHVVAWVPGYDGILGWGMLLALCAAAVVASRRLADDVVWIAVGVVALVLGVSSITAIARDGFSASGIGVALALCVVLLAMQAGRRLARTQARTEPQRFATAPFVWFVVLVLPALALGRALFGGQMADLARVWDPNVWTLLNFSTLWLWLAGALVALLVTVAVSLVPPSRSTHRLAKLITAILVIAALMTYIVPTARATVSTEADRLRTESVGDKLTQYCNVWSRDFESAPTVSLAFAGPGCNQIGAYDGSVRTSSSTVNYDLSRGYQFDMGMDLPSFVSAMYGDTIAVAAFNAAGTPGVIGIDFLTGAYKWESLCPPGTQTPHVRFAGTSNEDPAVLRQTLPGEGEGIFLTCDGVTQVLSPHP